MKAAQATAGKIAGSDMSAAQSLRNHFLLAMPGLADDMFAHTVTYLCEHNEHGAMGIVINQPLDLSLEEVLEHLKLSPTPEMARIPVMAGGPVNMDRGFILHEPGPREWEATLPVTEEIWLTTSRDILASMADGEGPAKSLVALGYAGWSPGQLEAEIADNSWLTLPADPAVIFDTPAHLRMHAAAARLGVDMNLLSADAGHA
ncbi:MAG: YqgE/AlgH family protein [Halieaceae bacterium]|jgi:putative transcriptional regulator|nr:YqgE/AlgH family protein [Halieaceae bacterium]